MNRQIRIVSALLSLVFIILLGATTYIQGIGANSLNQNPHNTRALYRLKYIDRGPIYAGNKKIAFSEKLQGNNRNRPEYRRGYSDDFRKYEHIVGILNSVMPPFGIENTEKATLMGEGKEDLFAQAAQYFQGKTKHGNGIRLTLIPALQNVAWESLGNRTGAAVAINYRTGEIVASVSKPDFDPTLFISPKASSSAQSDLYVALQKNPQKPLLNRVLSDNYPPGSTFKIITAAAILENTAITADTRIEAPNSYTPPDTNRTIYNYARSRCGNGNPTLKEAFARSCNVPFAIQGVKMGYQKLSQEAEKFGFNSGPAEATPLTLVTSNFPTKNPGPALLAQSAFGQYEVRATPLEMALVAATVANNGTQMKPTFIKEILSPDGQVLSRNGTGEIWRQPISPQTAESIKSMMYTMMDTHLPRYRRINGIRIGGKTGTAEIITTPDKAVNDAWFVAFSESAEKPYAVAVMIEGIPGGTRSERLLFGASDAAPVAIDILRTALK